MMTPIEAVTKLDDLRKELNRRFAQLGYEMEDIQERWACLGNIGGQRDDHAAELLYHLEPHFRELSSYCSRVEKQLVEMKADPFQRKQAVAKSA